MKKTVRDEQTIAQYRNHLNRIKGQIDGIIRLFEDDTYCLDIINQINAIRGSLGSVNKKLTNEHIDMCVRESKDIDESLNEIKELIDKITK